MKHEKGEVPTVSEPEASLEVNRQNIFNLRGNILFFYCHSESDNVYF